jgi:hypothetical protein
MARVADLVEFPRRAATATGNAALAPLRPFVPANAVDDWGRDHHLLRSLAPWLRLRWDVSVGGDQHLPSRVGALLVTNDRRLSFSPLYVSWALSEATGRPVRFVGRPDVAPVGPALRRMGAILDDPREVLTALRAGDLVLAGASPTAQARHAGSVDVDLVGAAIAAGIGVHPVASMSTPFGRGARVEVGPVVRMRRKRRGPLAEVELAEAVQGHLQKMLDTLGGVRTGVGPLDWWGEG